MNTRSFFKSLATIAIGSIVAPQVLIPKFADSFKWKRQAESGIYVLNPEWVNAPYEMAFYGHDFENTRALHPIIFNRESFKDTELTVPGEKVFRDNSAPLRMTKDRAFIPMFKMI